MTQVEKKTKIKRDGDFIPPDGGWGWMIVLAAGFSNLSALPVLQQFGILFRDHFDRLGITSSEMTTIFNMNVAFTSCVGLANGPMFRTYSYRAVSFVGALVTCCSLMMITYSYNFVSYLIGFSFYGAGYGISGSANALALNTYWKKRRRIATGLSWTTTGLGPILWPLIITFLCAQYGENGAVLLLSGFALHGVACALLLQPVEWHTKPNNEDKETLLTPDTKDIDEKPQNKTENDKGYFKQMSKIRSVFSSQYLYNEDDPVTTGYEITDPGTPMMLRANDGYFSQSKYSRSSMTPREGSARTSRMQSKKPSINNLYEISKKSSMTSLLENMSRIPSALYLNESKKNSSANLQSLVNEREPMKVKRKLSINLGTQIPESEIEDSPALKAPQDLKADEKSVVEKLDPEAVKVIADKAEQHTAGNRSLKAFRLDSKLDDNKEEQNLNNANRDEYDENTYLRNNRSNQSLRRSMRKKSNNFNYENEVLKLVSEKLEGYLKQNEDEEETEKNKLVINVVDETLQDEVFEKKEDEDTKVQLTFCQKVAVFFDLDLLKDFSFINLMLGITLANFSEINFSILTPFILRDYGMSKSVVAIFMSLLAGVDVCMRFCVPLIAGKIGWENNTFFLFGVMMMGMGRVILTFNQSYTVVLLAAFIVGFGKGLRTVFMALVIPTHVPLHKLPGATGIQLITAGIVYLTLGPVVGWIKDNASTEVTLHCLNIFTWLTALSWGLEKFVRSRQKQTDKCEVNP